MSETFLINRKAGFDYEFIDTYLAGIKLLGSEVKSIRDRRVSMVDSFCIFIDEELWVKNLIVTPMSKNFQHDPQRDKKILLRKKEIKKLKGSLLKGMTIVPTKIFTDEKNIIKIEIALAKGKKDYDKRQKIKERDMERDIKKYIKN
jgi:SsrA-binding protein